MKTKLNLQTENKLLEKESQFKLRIISAACTILTAIHTSLPYKFLLFVLHKSTTKGYITDEIETINYHKIKERLINDTREGVIIYPPTIDWNIPLAQRPQHMAKALANKGYLFLYCTNNIYDKVFGYKKISSNLYLTNQFGALLDSAPGAWIIFNAAHPGYSLEDLLNWKRLGFRIIYQYIDDLSPQLIGSQEYSKILKRHREISLDHIDIVVVSAAELRREMWRKFPKKIVFYIPNGVEYSHFNIKARKPPSDLLSILNQGKPVIGYHGAIASWLDVTLIKRISKVRPDWNIVLIGWDFDDTAKSFENNSNIYVLGIQPYEEIPKYVQWFDVAMIPFKHGDIAKSTSPLKLFEYMSAEKQVVVTSDMQECKGYEGVSIASDNKDFINKLEMALRTKNSVVMKKKLSMQAKENSWESRAEIYDKALKSKPVYHGRQLNVIWNELLKSKLIRQSKEIELIKNTKIFKLFSVIFPHHFF